MRESVGIVRVTFPRAWCHMSKSARLHSSDLRAIWELVNECRDLGDDHTVWHGHWLRGLGRLAGAEFVVGGNVRLHSDGRVEALNTVVCGWENGFDQRAFYRALAETQGEVSESPLIAAYFRQPVESVGKGFTRTDLLADRDWYHTPYYERIQAAIGIDHSLVTFRPFVARGGEWNSTCLARAEDVRAEFSLRDRVRVQEAQACITPLVGAALAGFAEPSPGVLTPRARAVLRCLLEGDSDKQVAARLKLSGYTVNQYVKVIFRHFRVSSRAELLARWVKRGWGRGGW